MLALQMVMFLTYVAQYGSFKISLSQLPLMLVFVVIQALFLARHIQEKEQS